MRFLMLTTTLGLLAFGSLSAEEGTFTNPIANGADPWFVKHGDHYLWCQTDRDLGILIRRSDTLTSPGEPQRVWKAPEEGPYSKQVWAPELHLLDGKWYVYFAASDGNNETHLTYVLESEDEDPLGNYQVHGPMYTGDDFERKSDNRWAIDMTVLEHGGKRYALWSGWQDTRDEQHLFIAPMASPTALAGARVRLAENDEYLWERTEEKEDSRGLHEAPQVLKKGSRTFVTYSCAASWLPTYKVGLLELTGDDPMDPSAWKKHPEPVFQSTEDTYGVGHSCFVESPDGTELWHIFHAKRDRDPGWRRSIFAQPFQFDESDFPVLGKPVKAGEPLAKPSGEVE